MTRRNISRAWLAVALGSCTIAGCTSVNFNDGETVAIRHLPTDNTEAVAEAADQACAESGKGSAVHVATRSMHPGAPKFLLADEISTFKCR